MKNVTTLLALLFWFVAAIGRAGDWPQYRGANHDGVSTEKLGVKTWPAGGLPVVWKAPTETGFSSLSIGGGKVFTLVQRDIEGVKTEVCIALDAKSGKELWSAPFGPANYDRGGDSGGGGDGPRSTPGYDDGRVYVLDSHLLLACLDANTGKVAWSHDLVKENGAQIIRWQNAASPLIDGDFVYAMAGGAGQALVAFDKKTGTLAWKKYDDKMTHATPVAATILGQRHVIFFTQSGLLAVEPKTGAELWRHPFPYNTSAAASPIVSGDAVYCSAGYGVGAGACKITKNGDAFVATELWRTPNQTINHWSTPVCKDGFLYGMFSFKEYGKGPMKCIELATGKEMWAQAGFGPGNCIYVDGHLLALTDKGELVLIEAKPSAYTEVSRMPAVGGKCWSMPSFSDGRIYVRSTTEGVSIDTTGAK